MLLTNAIEYLTNQGIPVNTRFKVLTGFDTEANTKDRYEGYWFNALNNSKIIENIERERVNQSGIFGKIGAVFSNTIIDDLKAKFKAASTSVEDSDDEDEDEDTQAVAQEAYIKTITDYLEKHKANKALASFQFEDPTKLAAREVFSNIALSQ